MTVEELRRILSGMPGDHVVHVRIQGLSRPLQGAFIETERRMVPVRWDEVNELAKVETIDIRRLILSDRMFH